jgi:uncharacterized membrane protein YbhN (UPF0104 family)
MAESSRRSRLLWLLLRVSVTLGAFAFLFMRTDIGTAAAALGAMPWQAPVIVCLSGYFAIGLGALRWRLLMVTCGATAPPGLAHLYRLTLVGLFYNTVLPGAVGGDVVRGLATAESFAGRGATSALAVTLLERMSGLAGLVTVASVAFFLNPLAGVDGLRFWGAIGLAGALLGTAGIAFGNQLARFLPGRLATLAAKLPDVRHPFGFALALVLSFGTQLTIIYAGHTLVAALEPIVRFADSAVVMPVVTVASYFPLTVAGAGAREAALVAVYRLVGVDEAKALAAALAFLSCQLFVAASGGALHLLKPLKS